MVYDFCSATLKRRFAYPVIDSHLRASTQMRVICGPFKGMQLVGRTLGSTLFPKNLGTYEMELHTVFSEIPTLGICEIINVGAGEGYYTIGVLYAGMSRTVYAFERDSRGDAWIRELAKQNGLAEQRLRIEGECTTDKLRDIISPSRTQAIIMDVECEEWNLLDPTKVPNLGHIPILVETHDFAMSGITQELTRRFEKTHRIRTINSQPREFSRLPQEVKEVLGGLPHYCQELALWENRPVMGWLWMAPIVMPHRRIVAVHGDTATDY